MILLNFVCNNVVQLISFFFWIWRVPKYLDVLFIGDKNAFSIELKSLSETSCPPLAEVNEVVSKFSLCLEQRSYWSSHYDLDLNRLFDDGGQIVFNRLSITFRITVFSYLSVFGRLTLFLHLSRQRFLFVALIGEFVFAIVFIVIALRAVVFLQFLTGKDADLVGIYQIFGQKASLLLFSSFLW